LSLDDIFNILRRELGKVFVFDCDLDRADEPSTAVRCLPGVTGQIRARRGA
jgi:hypothetical protein